MGEEVGECTELCDMVIADNLLYCSIQNGSDMIVIYQGGEEKM